MTDSSAKAVGMVVTGGALAIAFIGLLVAKGIIDADEARSVLEDALTRAAMHTGTWEGHEACLFIGGLLEAKFSVTG
jgi:polyhydroxyalkanoate synthesis regulator phasin